MVASVAVVAAAFDSPGGSVLIYRKSGILRAVSTSKPSCSLHTSCGGPSHYADYRFLEDEMLVAGVWSANTAELLFNRVQHPKQRKSELERKQRHTPTGRAKPLKMVLSNCAIHATRIHPAYRKPFDLIFTRAKNEEWRARRGSNPRPNAPEAFALSI